MSAQSLMMRARPTMCTTLRAFAAKSRSPLSRAAVRAYSAKPAANKSYEGEPLGPKSAAAVARGSRTGGSNCIRLGRACAAAAPFSSLCW